ncbi:MAG: hypothetical protein AAGG01_09035 [Planctomycetota bacterium]
MNDQPDVFLDPGDLVASSGSGSDIYANEDWLFVSARGHPLGSVAAGKVDIWKLSESGYELNQILQPTACSTAGFGGCSFGVSIASEGEWLAVGSFGGEVTQPETTGLVHLYHLDGDQWELHEILRPIPGPPGVGTGFGTGLAISGGNLFAGAGLLMNPAGPRGAVHRYELSHAAGATYAETLSPPAQSDEIMGSVVAAHPNRVAAGAVFSSGSVSIYDRSLSGWECVQVLERPLGNDDALSFGRAIEFSEDGNTLFVSDASVVPNEDDGRVYVYGWNKTAREYELSQTLEGREGSTQSLLGNQFGRSLRTSGRFLAIGSPTQAVNGRLIGCCEVYEQEGPHWVFKSRFAKPASLPDAFDTGTRVELLGGRLYVSGPYHFGGLGNAGGVYVWEFDDAQAICQGTDPAHAITAIKSGHPSGIYDIEVSGLDPQSWCVIALGDARRAAPGAVGTFCIRGPMRASLPAMVSAGQERIIFRNIPIRLSSGLRTTVQSFSRSAGSSAVFDVGPAALVFE